MPPVKLYAASGEPKPMPQHQIQTKAISIFRYDPINSGKRLNRKDLQDLKICFFL
jgi:hypothetical protein